jgi:hypothetical protein
MKINKKYVWFLKFKIQIFQTTLDGETRKPKVVDLEMLCNFAFDNFFIWNHLFKENYGWNFPTFEIQILPLTSDGEMKKIKVVALKKL